MLLPTRTACAHLSANYSEGVSKICRRDLFLPKLRPAIESQLAYSKKYLALVEFGAKMPRGMKRAKIKTAVPLSAGERYVEFTDSSKQLDRARKALGLKENEALLVFTDGEREFAVATDVH